MKILILTTFILSTTFSQELTKYEFIQKASKILNDGRTIKNQKMLRKLSRKSKSKIIDTLMDSAAFYETIFKFNLFFLKSFNGDAYNNFNTRVVKERYPDGDLVYDELAMSQGAAITAVQELAKNGDFLTLVGLDKIAYAIPRSRYFKNRSGEIEKPSSMERQEDYQKLLDNYNKVAGWVKRQKNLDKVEFCNKVRSKEFNFPVWSAFYESKLNSPISESSPFMHNYEDPLLYWCANKISDKMFTVEYDFFNFIKKLNDFKETIEKYSPDNYHVKGILDIQKHDVLNSEFKKTGPEFYRFNFAGTPFLNSSTNFNRKRASEILDTYFCDDLTPIGFISPIESHSDRHINEVSCLSCHYKLDPMAGFFKNIGTRHINFKGMETYITDDRVEFKMSDYESHWRSSNKNREWDIGYIRSVNNQILNSYGESIEDLYKIIRNSPEVKKCITKRAFSFFWGKEVLIDKGYFEETANEFIKNTKKNSSIAFKKMIKKILLSKTFSNKNSSSDECFDFVNEHKESKFSPPCLINDILKKNCILCHSESNFYPYLNLNKWVIDTNGAENFEHFDAQGKQLQRSITLKEMFKRISTDDVKIRMPKGEKYFSSKDREILFKWLNEELQK